MIIRTSLNSASFSSPFRFVRSMRSSHFATRVPMHDVLDLCRLSSLSCIVQLHLLYFTFIVHCRFPHVHVSGAHVLHLYKKSYFIVVQVLTMKCDCVTQARPPLLSGPREAYPVAATPGNASRSEAAAALRLVLFGFLLLSLPIACSRRPPSSILRPPAHFRSLRHSSGPLTTGIHAASLLSHCSVFLVRGNATAALGGGFCHAADALS